MAGGARPDHPPVVTAAIIVQPEAETDLDEAFQWYATRREGLGRELLDEVGRAFERIAESPMRPRSLYRGTRRIRLARFPNIVLYVMIRDTVFILAVLHERRSPRRFRERARKFGEPTS